MLYAILKPLMKAALRLYFRRIVTTGLGHIDNGRPTLILANHTASFMDAMITACFVRRRIHFFTRGDVFRHPVANKVMRSLGMLPVYRFSDGRDKLQLNDTSNEEALRILGRGGAVLIFVEGASDVAKVLKPLKKGPFRLALSAAATLKAPPLIVPMGINYITPAAPLGDAFLLAAPPMDVSGPTEEGEAAAARSATALMRRTATALRPLVWDIRLEQGSDGAEAMLRRMGEVQPHYSFADTQRLLQRLERETYPAREQDEAERLPEKKPGAPDLFRYAGLVAGAPPALAGYLAHALPVKLAEVITDALVRHADFRAPVFLSLAIVLEAIWNFVLLLLLLLAGCAWISAIILLLLAACGIFFIKWYRPALLSAGFGRRRKTPQQGAEEMEYKRYIEQTLTYK